MERSFQAVPEYQDCAALADSHQIPVAKVYTAALSAGNQLLEE